MYKASFGAFPSSFLLDASCVREIQAVKALELQSTGLVIA